MSVPRMPAAEFDISDSLVARLLADQQPDLIQAGGLQPLANGWDNTLFRLGSDLVVRLPRRAVAADLIVNEQRWLPVLAPELPLPVPVPVRVGRPTDYYPWPWSVVDWFEGRPVGAMGPGRSSNRFDHHGGTTATATAADQLGRFLAALHRPAPAEAPANPFRGGPLADRTGRMTDWWPALATAIGSEPTDAVRSVWKRAVDAEPWTGSARWLHGDLHSFNVLTDGARLSAVIDFGDLTAGDPATDLAAGWWLFDQAGRDRFRAAAHAADRPIDDTTWLRSAGWALTVSVAVVANSDPDGPMRPAAVSTLDQVLAEFHRR